MPKSIKKTGFSKQLRTTRTGKGLSQADLAAKTGLQPSAVSHFESGRRSPSIDNLQLLADALDVTTDHLLSRGTGPKLAGPTATRLFKRAEQLSTRDLEMLVEIADQLAKR